MLFRDRKFDRYNVKRNCSYPYYMKGICNSTRFLRNITVICNLVRCSPNNYLCINTTNVRFTMLALPFCKNINKRFSTIVWQCSQTPCTLLYHNVANKLYYLGCINQQSRKTKIVVRLLRYSLVVLLLLLVFRQFVRWL